MLLTLQRSRSNETCTLGMLHVNGFFQCYTLEDKVRELPGMPVEQWKIKGQTAIPAGKYQVIINMSSRFKKELPLLLDVPGFSGIRIHAGNKAEDTEGCLLVGNARAENMVLDSRAALHDLQPKIQAALDAGEQVWIDVQTP